MWSTHLIEAGPLGYGPVAIVVGRVRHTKDGDDRGGSKHEMLG